MASSSISDGTWYTGTWYKGGATCKHKRVSRACGEQRKTVPIGAVLLLAVVTATAVVPRLDSAVLSVGEGQEYATITEAFAAAANNDVIEIHEGVYTDYPDFSGSATPSGLTFRRYENDKVVIQVSALYGDRNYIYIRRKSNYKFHGLIFDGQGSAAFCLYLRTNMSNNEFKNCVFVNPGKEGVYLYSAEEGGVRGTKFINCTFYGLSKGIRNGNRDVSGTVVSNSLFVACGVAVENNSPKQDSIEPGYSAFWDNTEDVAGNRGGVLGEGCVTDSDPLFASVSLGAPSFMHLSEYSPESITRGSSEGTHIGARGMMPPTRTVILVR